MKLYRIVDQQRSRKNHETDGVAFMAITNSQLTARYIEIKRIRKQALAFIGACSASQMLWAEDREMRG